MRRIRVGLSVLIVVAVVVLSRAAADSATSWRSYFPLAYREPTYTPTSTPTPTPTPTPSPTPPPPSVEFRGLWVTRFDWTDGVNPASAAKIDQIVQNVAAAGFNVILFQVRGSADAYYAPGLEPWAQRVSGGEIGQPPNPWWDPLAYFVNAAHARGLQLHAYLNVYPVWDKCGTAPPWTAPTHFYYLLQSAHGTTGGKLNGLQWDTNDQIHCSVYQRSSPASVYADNHFLAVAQDLVNRYAIDGIHLDNIRYGGSNTSCDPVSEGSYGANCFADGGYASWQRTQVNGTVWKFYDQIVPLKPGLWLTAAVWPIYIDYWGWGGQQGYSTYYQDSKAWVQDGYIDSIMPMIYPNSYDCPYQGFWDLGKWTTLVADFQATSGGRYILPGIGAGYCTFDEISNRIAAARSIGTAGHAIFSYGGLAAWGYFDDLAAGPYAAPAAVPSIPWHP
jgi:uncharacterized lipoprotein YddW (UPF0748 family)